jgi:hypothetical protein
MMILLLLLWIIALAPITTVQGYASWLKCFVDLDPEEVIMNSQVVPASEARELVRIQVQPEGSDEWMYDFEYDGAPTTTTTTTTLNARLQVSSALQEQRGGAGVQFVMETSSGAEFVDRGTMCQGRRSSSRNYNEHVTLKISGDQDVVELIAGWATGHEAVTLTERLVLRRKEAATVTAATEL